MHSDYTEEFAFAKLNLSFKVLKKLPNNFHQIESYITFLPNIYDHLIIKKSLQNKIVINGHAKVSLRDSETNKTVGLLTR